MYSPKYNPIKLCIKLLAYATRNSIIVYTMVTTKPLYNFKMQKKKMAVLVDDC